MKIPLTIVKQLDGKWLKPATSYAIAASPLGAIQELAYRTQTKWRKAPSGWHKERKSLLLLYVGPPPYPPLPEIRTFSIEEYFKQDTAMRYVVRHQILALSEREAVTAMYYKTLARNQRLATGFGGRFRKTELGWESPVSKLLVEELNVT